MGVGCGNDESSESICDQAADVAAECSTEVEVIDDCDESSAQCAIDFPDEFCEAVDPLNLANPNFSNGFTECAGPR